MTELARPTSTRLTMTEAKTKRAPPRRAGSENTFRLDTGRRFTEGRIKGLLTEHPVSGSWAGPTLSSPLTYLRHRLTNAGLEGVNAIIQRVKKTARGFRNAEHFKTAI